MRSGSIFAYIYGGAPLNESLRGKGKGTGAGYLHNCYKLSFTLFCTLAQQPPSGPRRPHYRGFTIALRHITLGRTPLDE